MACSSDTPSLSYDVHSRRRGVALSRPVDIGPVPLEMLISRARRLAMCKSRSILGIAGPPGAGKSTLADAVADALGDLARLVPMDGFHLAQGELARLGLSAVKGSPSTFDARGYINTLRRLRIPREDVVYAPAFDRQIEEPIAGSIAVPADVPLVVTEGNYLLSTLPSWADVRDLLDEAWYCSIAPDVRHERLVDRHVRYGKSREEAESWAAGSDERNAALVEETRHRANLVFSLAHGAPVDVTATAAESTG